MQLDLLIQNLSNPALLFFILGIIAVYVKSDLEIPANSSKFISLYLLFAIGFKGGQALKTESFTLEIAGTMGLGIVVSLLIPIFTFFVLKRRMSVYDAGAISAAYGSVSAVTFITGVAYLESMELTMRGYMVAIMALMEAPAIIAGLMLIQLYKTDNSGPKIKKRDIISHSLTNGSVLLILGSLIIGMLADSKQAEGIKPFTNELFAGFLAIFLLDMGIESGRKLKAMIQFGWYPFVFAIVIPIINGVVFGLLSTLVITDLTSQFMFAVLAASASYIAVPAAMKITVPQANPGLYLPMALAVTFPFNITFGMPLYFMVLSVVQ